MKKLTSNPQLNAPLNLVAAHAKLTGLVSSKDIFLQMREEEAAQDKQREQQNTFERLSETLYLQH